MDIYSQFEQLYGVSSTETTERPKKKLTATSGTGSTRKQYLNPLELKDWKPNQSRYFRLQPWSPKTMLRVTGDATQKTSRIEYSLVWFKAVVDDGKGGTKISGRTHVFQDYAPLICRPFSTDVELKGTILSESVQGGNYSVVDDVLTIYPDGASNKFSAKTSAGQVIEVPITPLQNEDLILDPEFKGDKATQFIDAHLQTLIADYKETGDASKLQMHNDYLTPRFFDRSKGKKKRPITVEDPLSMKDIYYSYKSKGVIVQGYEVAEELVEGSYESIKVHPLTEAEYQEAVKEAVANGLSAESVKRFKLGTEERTGKLSVPLHNEALQLVNIRPSGQNSIFGDTGIYREQDIGNSLFRLDEGVDLHIKKHLTKDEKGKEKISYVFKARRSNSSVQGINPIEALSEGFLDPFELFLENSDRGDLFIESYKFHMGIEDPTEEDLPFSPDALPNADVDTEEDSFIDALA